MNAILDTDVLSLLAPERPEPPVVLRRWIADRSDRLFISVVSVAEIERGIRKLTRTGKRRKAVAVRDWFSRVVETYEERILPFDLEAARIAGRLDDEATAKGFNILFADVAIAATAARHDMEVATCNVRHFEPLGARLAKLPL